MGTIAERMGQAGNRVRHHPGNSSNYTGATCDLRELGRSLGGGGILAEKAARRSGSASRTSARDPDPQVGRPHTARWRCTRRSARPCGPWARVSLTPAMTARSRTRPSLPIPATATARSGFDGRQSQAFVSSSARSKARERRAGRAGRPQRTLPRVSHRGALHPPLGGLVSRRSRPGLQPPITQLAIECHYHQVT